MKLDFDGDVHAGWEIELLELVHGAGGWVHDVENALVSAEFELIDALFVDVRGTVHAEFFDPCWKRDRASNFGAGALGGVHDFIHGLVQGAEIISTETDADALVLHDG